MKTTELIFLPVPGPTHLVSTLEFAKLLLHRDDRIRITILTIKPLSTVSADDIYKRLTEPHPQIQLVELPHVDPPSPDLLRKPFEVHFPAFVESHKAHVKAVISNIIASRSDSTRVAGLVVDFFCVPMIDVADELGLPSYIYLTTNAGFLAFMLYLPTRHSEISSECQDSDSELSIPGFVNRVPPRVLPRNLFNKDGGYAGYLKLARRFRDVEGIIVNTFTDLEPSMLESFRDCGIPAVYPVGPLLQLKLLPNPNMDQVQCEKMMRWLDEQPESSVVFLCFGSHGSLGAPQVKEMALGLERSGLRFLWSIRLLRPNSKDSAHYSKPEDMLPDGFLDRIQGRGMICGWAPQVEILAHKAIGGFVSHCGWNSILESLWYGVPVATWPIYAEQQLNAFNMVKELGLAVEVRLDYGGERDLVMADEVERAVKGLMDGDNEVREKVKRMSEMAKIALMDGGSSFNSIGFLIKDIVATACNN